ncbi:MULTISPECIES: Cdc6/Cdc18 family protein [Haloarcula]|uniref:Cdc6/Cdc18 family protein n=1 Tax=Haloarcula TaxID=2237 RepID=UPI0013DEB3ED|nr:MULTISPECIES: orc1/cdc6 family replication initiation protein [Haloarcula]NHX41415.1 AAA family ATPase [Haloarcula sp. R1-2]
MMFDEEVDIFTNEDVLRTDWVPDEIPEREDEMDKIEFAMRPITNGSTPHNLFLYGKSGQGKTAVTKFMLEDLQEYFESEESDIDKELNISYVSCQDAESSYQVLGEILTVLEDDTEKRPKGFSTGDLNKRLFDNLEESGGFHILILDEIDAVGSDDSILYQIPRAAANGKIEEAQVSIVGISNDFKFYNQFSRKVDDTLSAVEIHFEPYDADQLRTILQQRVEISFKDGVLEPGVIPQCAALAAQDHGSARQAIEYIHRAGELARHNVDESVTEEHVSRAQDQIDREKLIENFRSMTTQDKLALTGLLVLELKSETPSRTKEIYDEYVNVTEMIDAETYTQRRMYEHLQAMTTHGFADSKEINRGHREGRHLEFELAIGVDEALDALEQEPRFNGLSEKLYEIQSVQ